MKEHPVSRWRTILVALLFGFVAATMPLAAQVVINEFVALNQTGLQDQDGDNSDWIEIWNKGNSSVNLAGYHLTNDPLDLEQWTFPSTNLGPGSYLLVFASNKDRRVSGSQLHTNFRLGGSGEYLALVEPNGSTVAFEYAPQYPVQSDDISYGLAFNSGALPGLFLNSATPGSGNTGGSPLYEAPAPVFTQNRGFYTSGFSVSFPPQSGLSIRYTLDGSTPTPTYGQFYSGSLSINSTTIVRAIQYGSGVNPSPVITHSYLFANEIANKPYMRTLNDGFYDGQIPNALTSIPSISLVSDDITYVDDDLNFDEAAVSAEMIFPGNTEPGFQINAGFETWGGSPTNPKKHYRLEFKSEYGESKLKYPVFDDGYEYPDEPVEEFDRLLLRGGSQDGLNCEFCDENRAQYVRNRFQMDLQMLMGFKAPHGRYVHVYLNGEYKGQYHLLERPDEHFFSSYFGKADEQYEIRKSGVFTNGSGNFFDQMESAAQNISSYSGYQNLRNYLDLDQAATYLILNHWAGNFDWRKDHNSLGGADLTPGEGGYKMMLWDLDLTMANGGKWGGTYNAGTWNGTAETGPVPENLYNNTEFRQLMADKLECECFNGGLLTPTVLDSLYMLRANQVEFPLIAESSRWGNTFFEYPNGHIPANWEVYQEWQAEKNRVRSDFLINRTNRLRSYYTSRGVLNSRQAVVFNTYGGVVPNGYGVTLTNPNSSGTIYYTTDGTDPRAFGGSVSGSAMVGNGPISITTTTEIKARVRSNGQWSPMCPRTFYPSGYFMDLAINEIHYNPLEEGDVGQPNFVDGDEYEFIEIRNNGSQSVDLGGVTFSDGIEYTFAGGATIGANGYAVIAANPTRFQERYGFTPYGPYVGNLANSGERLELQTPYGGILDSLTYDDVAPWDPDADGTGSSLSLKPGVTDNSIPSSWARSTDLHGTPNAVNLVSVPPVLSITAPANNARFDPGTPFTVQVNASDPDAGDSVASVRIHSGSLTLATLTSPPYQTTWSPPPGGYILEASATDQYGVEGTATPIFISVVAANPCAVTANVVINEISYAQSSAKPSGDWVEVYNPTGSAIDLSGWVLKDSQNEHWFVFAEGTTLGAWQYLIIARDLAAFESVHAGIPAVGSTTWGLGSGGDTVRLISPTGCEVDFVGYQATSPWPVVSAGSGRTIELKNATSNNALAQNWQLGASDGGTPGATNSGLSQPAISPVSDQTTFIGVAVNLGLSASDPNGPLTWTVSAPPAGLTFNGNNNAPAITGSPTASGVTTVKVSATNALGLTTTISFNWTVISSTPEIVWYSPPDGGGYASGTPVSMDMDAKSGAGIAEVRVFVDGELVGNANASGGDLYRRTLSGLSDGPHTIHVEVATNSGEVLETETRSFELGTPGTGPYLEAGGRVAMEAEYRDTMIPRGAHQWVLRNNIPGFSAGGFMKAEPDNGTEITANYQTTSPELNYRIRFDTPGTYTAWFRTRYVGAENSSFAVGVDGVLLASPLTVPASGDWRWVKAPTSFVVASAEEERLLQVWMAKDGAVVDRIVMDDGGYVPAGYGPVSSPREVSTVKLAVKAQLSGPWSSGGMSTKLAEAGLLPKTQPYAGLPALTIDDAFIAAHPEIVDWVWIELRTSLDASSSVYKAACLITEEGTLMDTQGNVVMSLSGVSEGAYHLVLGHRNHLSVITGSAISLSGEAAAGVDLSAAR